MTALRSRFAHLHGDARLDVLAAKVADGEHRPVLCGRRVDRRSVIDGTIDL